MPGGLTRLLVPLPALVLAAGCTSSSTGPTPSVGGTATGTAAATLAPQPQPTKPISVSVDAINRAITDQSCAEYAPVVFSLNRQTLQPGAAPVGNECRYFNAQLQAFKGSHFSASQTFGTGALVDGKDGSGANVTLVFALDRDGAYRYDFAVTGGTPQVGSKPATATGSGTAAQTFVDAIKDGDCKRAAPLIYAQSPLLQPQQTAAAACAHILSGRLLVPELQITADPRVQQMGGTQDFAFFGLPTRDGWFTIVMYGGPSKTQAHLLPDRVDDVVVDTDVPGIAQLATAPSASGSATPGPFGVSPS